MSDSDHIVSKTLLRSFVPLSTLADEQLDLLLEKSEVVHLFKGQTLINVGEGKQEHLYLIHGKLLQTELEKEDLIIEAGGASSYLPIAHSFPRSATVFAETDASVLKINSDFLEKILCWGQVSRCLLAEIAGDEKYLEDYFWIKRLLESKLFYKVPPMNIRKVLDKFQEMPVEAGFEVIKEGDEGACCYLIKSGEADVRVQALDNKVVATLPKGTVFGEDALVNNKPRNATVTMTTAGVLMKLEKEDFIKLLAKPVVTMVTPGNVAGFLSTGAALIDARTETEFDEGHHAQAVNVPLHLIYLKSSVLDKNRVHITYSPTEERAVAAAFLLTEQGFEAYALQAGTNGLPKELAAAFSEAS